MNITQIRSILLNFSEIRAARIFDGVISINQKVLFPIRASFYIDRSNEISINDELDIKIGYLLFLRDTQFDFDSATEDQQMAFLNEYPEVKIPRRYQFKYDYVVINEGHLKKYKRFYKKGTPIWGYYYHISDLKEYSNFPSEALTKLNADSKVLFTSEVYKRNAIFSVTEINPFIRFLKLYHLLELQFDIHTAEEITNAKKDFQKIGKLLRDYKREDIERLSSLIKTKCKTLPSLEIKLNAVKKFHKRASIIYFDFGKDSNPIFSKTLFEDFLDKGGFTPFNIAARKLDYGTFIPKLTAYFIYRIRSSIAHNKLGEYLMSDLDLKFVVNFAEPLLREVVKQCFKK